MPYMLPVTSWLPRVFFLVSMRMLNVVAARMSAYAKKVGIG